ncbi:MAG: hypothetical protein J0H19_18700 [Rhodospirillales bacterium]|nr:hypothetical protein [Rhodospirillales bacterium]MBN8928645.1 hypothetical protein [Rhodospirillales bacterium]
MNREPIMEALKAKLSMPEFKTVSRRLRMFGDVPHAEMPALFIIEPSEAYAQTERLPSKTTFDVELWVYICDGVDQNTVPVTVLNGLLDKIDDALSPDPPPHPRVQTLGGLVSHCWIEGQIEKTPGDLDGIGLARIPLKILIP